MKQFYIAIKPQTNDIHSIHREGCPFMPASGKRIFLGTFQSADDAEKESRKYFTNSCTCRFCNKENVAKAQFNIPDSILNGTACYSETMLSFMN